MNHISLDMLAPPITAQAYVNGTQKQISLGDYTGEWLILLFYGSDFTFV